MPKHNKIQPDGDRRELTCRRVLKNVQDQAYFE